MPFYNLANLNQGGGGFATYDFFSYIIGLLVIVVFTLAYKIILLTKWQDPMTMTADLVTGRRELTAEEIQQLDAYFSRPMWRRLGEYIRLWWSHSHTDIPLLSDNNRMPI